MIRKLPKNSAYLCTLPRGCVYCGPGQKLVLFVTGLCNNRCFYCPLSDAKKGKDVMFANERKIRNFSDIIEEAKLIDSKGTGITGGDPLAVPDKTSKCIRLLKSKFGKKHHIHLYTASTDIKIIRRIAKSGLDEIRFHPPMNLWDNMRNSKFHNAIMTALDNNMDTGVEIPAIPGTKKQIRSLIEYLDDVNAGFLNLNELEFSETNYKSLLSRGYRVKDDVSSGVKGSEELALGILRDSDKNFPVHYCSSSYKDGVQLRNRITRRAKNIARPSDIISDDGLLVKGIIECDNLHKMYRELLVKHNVPKALVYIDNEKNRIEIAPWVLEKIAKRILYDAYIIEEYPTADRLEVERMRIN